MTRANASASDIREGYLTPQEVAETRKPLEQATMLPLRVYGSKEFYQREIESVFHPSWHPVARTDQLLEPGAYVTAGVLGEQVLVTRDRDGVIRAMSNVCRHRGTKLLSGCGTVKAIVCPYHTWTYNLDGSLRGAPHMAQVDNFDRKTIALTQFKVEIWNGFVFVNFDPHAKPLTASVTELTEKLAPFQLEKWISHPWMERSVDWNWKISMENFSEAYHHVGVHRDSIGTISRAEAAIYEKTNNNYSLFYVHIPPHEGQIADYPFAPVPGLPEFFNSYSPVLNIYPTFHLVLATNFVLWLRFEINDVKEHKLIWRLLVPPGGDQHADFDQRFAAIKEMLLPILNEDVGFMPMVRDGVGSRTAPPGRYCGQERAVHQMHLWLLDQMEHAPPQQQGHAQQLP
jgi:choline monooxygenase